VKAWRIREILNIIENIILIASENKVKSKYQRKKMAVSKKRKRNEKIYQ